MILDLPAIRQRLKNITPAPWCWEATGEKSNDYCVGTAFGPNDQPIRGRLITTDDPGADASMDDAILTRHFVGEGEGNLADADFIAHAPDDIAALLTEVDRLAREHERDAVELDRVCEVAHALEDRAKQAEAERDALKAQLAAT